MVTDKTRALSVAIAVMVVVVISVGTLGCARHQGDLWQPEDDRPYGRAIIDYAIITHLFADLREGGRVHVTTWVDREPVQMPVRAVMIKRRDFRPGLPRTIYGVPVVKVDDFDHEQRPDVIRIAFVSPRPGGNGVHETTFYYGAQTFAYTKYTIAYEIRDGVVVDVRILTVVCCQPLCPETTQAVAVPHAPRRLRFGASPRPLPTWRPMRPMRPRMQALHWVPVSSMQALSG